MTEAMVDQSAIAIESALRQRQEEQAQRVSQLQHDARAVHRAMEGWQRVESEDAWLQLYAESAEAHRSGRFLMERLGSERFLEPELMAVLVQLRRGLVGPEGGSASEAMAADLAITAYYNALRIQQWIGDLAIAIEREFFGGEAPSARFDRRYGRGTGLVVEEHLQRLGEQLLPLQERANRMMLRNLKLLADLQRAPTPSVAIGTAQQVNVASQQINVSHDADRQ